LPAGLALLLLSLVFVLGVLALRKPLIASIRKPNRHQGAY
jgi:hypothetical protein